MTLRSILPLAFAAVLSAVPALAAPRTVVLDPQKTTVGFTLEATGHDVHGGFALRRGEITFDDATGAASGELVVDLAGAETGSKKRDKQMHAEVLETPSFPLATFKASKLVGTVRESGVSDVSLEGVLLFHGAEHPVALPAHLEIAGGVVKADVAFPVPFVAWGLHDPSILILRVAKTVAVEVHALGRLQEPAVAAHAGR